MLPVNLPATATGQAIGLRLEVEDFLAKVAI